MKITNKARRTRAAVLAGMLHDARASMIAIQSRAPVHADPRMRITHARAWAEGFAEYRKALAYAQVISAITLGIDRDTAFEGIDQIFAAQAWRACEDAIRGLP